MRRREYAGYSGLQLPEAHLYASSQIIGTPAFYLSATTPAARTVAPSRPGQVPATAPIRHILKLAGGWPIICLRPSRSPGAPRTPHHRACPRASSLAADDHQEESNDEWRSSHS